MTSLIRSSRQQRSQSNRGLARQKQTQLPLLLLVVVLQVVSQMRLPVPRAWKTTRPLQQQEQQQQHVLTKPHQQRKLLCPHQLQLRLAQG